MWLLLRRFRLDSSTAMTASKDELQNSIRTPTSSSVDGLDEGDISLIHWMLSLTPTQRLERARDFLVGALTLRNGRKLPS